MTKVAEIMKMFATAFPVQTDWIPSTNQVRNMNHACVKAAIRYGAPELDWLKNWLRKNMPLGNVNETNGEKVTLWMYRPIIRWFVELYCHVLGCNCFAIHGTMQADTRASIKEKFIKKDDVLDLVLSYITNNKGLNLHNTCQNSIMLQQGVNYAAEHEFTHHLVTMAMIDRLIEAVMSLKQQPVHYSFGVIPKASADGDADEVYEALIGIITLRMLKSRLIGLSNIDDDAMNVDANGS
ncbi:hypothetical protein BDD12DRAFT_873295 [Trichophaea hybrida]|nr:hypothetical protein BDD12DRAFT_873295 [Trichophaea hybrida]